MTYIIPKAQLSNGNLFQGGKYDNVPISFFWVEAAPGRGSRLHCHPYAEVFVVQEGQATFTVGESTIEVEGGHVVVGPANIPHKFINSGTGPLRMINIHPSEQTIQQWLEE
ncbi:cupin domain-containing protein [Ktedonosporobacter rubrisoli]|uniref:Cupin domain-containing protein n=1 Tax=Ktedonosporobacter rubrisoli TaxID=2509675 RepID=A0A4P6JYV8_KTERU|nr:cupin domain-containing protein [Ktedonosporobacter rubrisoli]QBD80650.1 cupin domain-containing protein [Ktedonosporobacter rubrisoli]